MKALKPYNTEAINMFHKRNIHNTDVVEEPPVDLIEFWIFDRIPSTTPGAEPPRDVRDSGSARSHSTHLETSSSDRP